MKTKILADFQIFVGAPLKALIYRSRHRPRVFSKKVVLKVFAKLTGKYLCQCLPFKNVSGCTKNSLDTFRIKKDVISMQTVFIG